MGLVEQQQQCCWSHWACIQRMVRTEGVHMCKGEGVVNGGHALGLSRGPGFSLGTAEVRATSSATAASCLCCIGGCCGLQSQS